MEKLAPSKASVSGTVLIGNRLPIYRLGFGAMRITGPGIWGPPADLKEAQAVLRRVIELGVNFIDTADSYGPDVSENLIAQTLYPYPKGLVIATKGGHTRPGPNQWVINGRPEYLRKCVEASLKRLRLDCIDLYQLHRIDPQVPVEDSLGALKEFQKQGKIRFIGLSEVSVPEIERASKTVEIASVQNLYNVLNRRSESVLKFCEKKQLIFIPYYPLASGDLTRQGGELEKLAKKKGISVAQLGLAWLLKHSTVVVPIPGTSSLSHLEENMAAASIELTAQEMALLDSLASGVS
jgi:aryl-alcohol dehydrogenase-like predicted oxidoreductase